MAQRHIVLQTINMMVKSANRSDNNMYEIITII